MLVYDNKRINTCNQSEERNEEDPHGRIDECDCSHIAKRVAGWQKCTDAKFWDAGDETKKRTRGDSSNDERTHSCSREDATELQSECLNKRTIEKRIRYG